MFRILLLKEFWTILNKHSFVKGAVFAKYISLDLAVKNGYVELLRKSKNITNIDKQTDYLDLKMPHPSLEMLKWVLHKNALINNTSQEFSDLHLLDGVKKNCLRKP